MPPFNKRRFGSMGELYASKYLIGKGYKIIKKNLYTPYGEVDLIAKKSKYYYFTEVKLRTSKKYGVAIEAVNKAKIEKIIKSALYFAKSNSIKSENIKVLVLAIDIENEKLNIREVIYS